VIFLEEPKIIEKEGFCTMVMLTKAAYDRLLEEPNRLREIMRRLEEENIRLRAEVERLKMWYGGP
jgi:hypothetical protein